MRCPAILGLIGQQQNRAEKIIWLGLAAIDPGSSGHVLQQLRGFTQCPGVGALIARNREEERRCEQGGDVRERVLPVTCRFFTS